MSAPILPPRTEAVLLAFETGKRHAEDEPVREGTGAKVPTIPAGEIADELRADWWRELMGADEVLA